MSKSIVIALILAGAVGCGSGAPAGSDLAAASLPDLASAPDLTTAPTAGYPPGPYGNAVGSVVPNFTFQGYYSLMTSGLSSSQPYGAVTFDRIRTSGKKYLLL